MQNFNEQLYHLIEEALHEDVGDGDHTTLSCIPSDKTGKAILNIKQNGILAGVEVAQKIFSFVEEDIQFNALKKDGDEKSWKKSCKQILADLQKMRDLVSDEKIDLFARIPHGDGQTILREALLVADHNAYHLGQIVLLMKILEN